MYRSGDCRIIRENERLPCCSTLVPNIVGYKTRGGIGVGDSHWLIECEGTIQDVCDTFQLGEWTGRWASLGGAYNENVLLVTDTGAYVIRITNRAIQTDQLQEIYRVTHYLHEHGVPVPIPLTTSGGEPYLYVQDRLLQIIPYAEGRSFAGGGRQVMASGQMLRLFHDGLAEVRCELTPPLSFFRPLAYCCDALSTLRGADHISRFGLDEAEQVVEEVYARWDSVRLRLPSSILHGDWHFWNQLYVEDQVSCVVDLDYMQHGPRILDIAYALWMIHILLPQHAELYRTAFLSGYGELTADEIDILPDATARIALFFLCHTAENAHPTRRWYKQYAHQMPFIRWLLSEGREQLRVAASYATSS